MILCSPKFLFSIQRVCTLPLSFNFLMISLLFLMPDLNSTVARKEAVKKHHQGWRAVVTFGTCGIYDLKRTMCHDGFSSPLKFCLTLTTGDHTIPKNLISFFFPFSFVFSSVNMRMIFLLRRPHLLVCNKRLTFLVAV